VALSGAPGRSQPVHDHVIWCVFGVEHEELFDADLNPIGEGDNRTGDVSGFAPPGDIHRVKNTGDETAISIHVYGTDLDMGEATAIERRRSSGEPVGHGLGNGPVRGMRAQSRSG
jgi:predicted metal-dependent enzyme (double-stranded beta helix superfamily)